MIGTFDFSIFHPLFDVPLKLHAKETKQKKETITSKALIAVCSQRNHSCENVFCSLLGVGPLIQLVELPKDRKVLLFHV